ncbi:MAG: fatty acid desaturase [Gammaproteobacteria bacterium]|nr:fatty acid desaturase [Gammaproteobacteria bacterium]
MTTATDQPAATLADSGGAKRLAALRDALAPFRHRRTGTAVRLFVGDVLLMAAGQALVILGPGLLLKLLGALVTWVGIVRLFLIGHDACHGALTDSDRLNSLLGRLAFLPSLTPFSLWHVGHNVVHHGFNNLRGRDFVWEPKSPEDYRELSPWRRTLERLYRSAAGPAPYYFLEIWWKRLYFPGLTRLKTVRWQFIADCTAVTVVCIAWVAGLVAAAAATGTSALLLVGLGLVLPFILWIWTVGLVVYLHHTAPDLRWFDDRREWLRQAAQATATRHLTLPPLLESLLHQIMAHPVHHLDGTIPCYHLKAAQRRLMELLPEIKPVRLTWGYYRECVRICKTYDFSANAWRPFGPAGREAVAPA